MREVYEWKTRICEKKTMMSFPFSFYERFKEIEPLHFECIFKLSDNESNIDTLIARDIDSHRELLKTCPHFLGARMLLVRDFTKIEEFKLKYPDVDFSNQYPGIFIRKRDLIDKDDFMDEAMFMLKLFKLNRFLAGNFDNGREIKILQATLSTIDGAVIIKAYPDEEFIPTSNKYSNRAARIIGILNDLINIMKFPVIKTNSGNINLLLRYNVNYDIKNIDVLKYVTDVSIYSYKCEKSDNGDIDVQPCEAFNIRSDVFKFRSVIDIFADIAAFMSIYSELYHVAFSMKIALLGTKLEDSEFDTNTDFCETMQFLDIYNGLYKFPIYSNERKFIKMVADEIPLVNPYEILRRITANNVGKTPNVIGSIMGLFGDCVISIPPNRLMPLYIGK